MNGFKKALPRMFFAAAAVVMLGTSFRVPVAQAQPDEDNTGVCADGNRKLCATVPTTTGTRYYYWI